LGELLERSGFQDAKVKATEVIENEETGAVNVVIQVKEGPKHWVRSLRIETFITATNQPIYTETIYPKAPYSQLWVQDMVQTLKATNYIGGYPDTTVEVKTLGRESITNSLRLDLLATVMTGPQIEVGRVR